MNTDTVKTYVKTINDTQVIVLEVYDSPKLEDYAIKIVKKDMKTGQEIKDKDFDLVLSGHSHGGQVRLPIIGKIITPPGSKKYYDEYYNVNDTKMYVSYGLGTSLLRLRLFDHPSFNLYRIYSE